MYIPDLSRRAVDGDSFVRGVRSNYGQLYLDGSGGYADGGEGVGFSVGQK